jgi:hypothetical protein
MCHNIYVGTAACVSDEAYTFRVGRIESGEDGHEVVKGFMTLLKETVMSGGRYAFEAGNRRLL